MSVSRRTRPAQRGVTLIVLMIMLVVVTLVTLSSIRSTTQQERMAGNSRDRQRAFQAAEAAVQFCLGRLKDNTYLGTKSDPAAGTATPLWEVAANWVDGTAVSMEVEGTAQGLTTDAKLSSNPRCMVEKLDAANKSFRVTGRAVGGSEDSVVMLQATYSTE